MKVSIVVGGRWHAFDLAKELHQAGVLHRIITNYPKYKTRQWGIPDSKVVSLPLSMILQQLAFKIGGERLCMKLQYFIHGLFGISAAKHLEGSTIIHGWSSFCEPALHWAKENNVPFILERSSAHMLVQTQILQEEYAQLGLNWAATHPKIIAQEITEYELADKVAVPSSFVKRSFLSQKFPQEHLIYNPFGTNISTFAPGIKSDEVFRVVYAGALSVRKGIHYLVDAFVEADIPNSELCLVGNSTAETPKLLARADDRVKCVGHVTQAKLADYYHNSSVFVMASIEEGMAMVQLQALGCGLPLICTTNTGGEDLLKMSGVEPIKLEKDVQEYPAGFLVPARDSHAIATCLKLLSSDKNKLLAKRLSARSLRETNLSWQSYGQRSIDFYRSLHKIE
jgi:alpha-maltose-1-phosphate synthase